MTRRARELAAAALAAARRCYQAQLRLQQAHVDRFERSGAETLAATHALRWRGDLLVGEVLPAQVPLEGPPPADGSRGRPGAPG